jgi:hypothetical protein
VDDRQGKRVRHRTGQPVADCRDVRQVASPVDLPQLREPAHLPLEVAARADELGDGGRAHVRRVDLDQRVDELEA